MVTVFVSEMVSAVALAVPGCDAQADDHTVNGRNGVGVGGIFFRLLQLLLCLLQTLLQIKDGVLGVLAVDLHQQLTGGNGEIVDQIGGYDRAGGNALVR